MFNINLRSNLRYALRRLMKSPGFTATAIFSLALGIGANTAIFSLVNAVLLRDLPVRAPEEVVEVYLSTPDFAYNVFSYPDYKDLRDGSEAIFSGVASSRLILTQADQDGGVETLIGEAVSGNFFSTLGVEPQVGRMLLQEDDISPGGHPVVMLGHEFWQKEYAGDPGVIGQELRLGGRSYSIIGVVPKAYSGSLRALTPAIYAPMMMINELQPGTTDDLEARGNHSLFVKARLRPEVSMVQAQGVVDGIAASLREADVDNWDPDAKFLFVPHQDVIIFPAIDVYLRAASWLLMAVVGLVLLMACTNLASFLLAKSLDRRKEIAVRLAMGAQRRSLVTQLLTETTLLGILGGLAGVAFAVFLLRLLTTSDLPLPLPIAVDLSLDARVLTFSLVVSVLAGLLLGLAPALQNLRGDVAQALRSESAGAGQGGKLELRNALVVFQVAVSLLLLLAAGLFLRSMDRIQSVDPGFGHEPTALLSFLIPSTQFDEAAGQALAERLVDRFEQLPGVEAVGLTGNLQLNVLNTQTMDVNADGVEPPEGREAYSADRAVVDHGFFDAVGIQIVEGRGFNLQDRADSQPVAIVSHAMAQTFWPRQDAAEVGGAVSTSAVGQMIRRSGDAEDLLIVGVAADTKVRSLGEAPRLFVYQPLAQDYSSFLTAVVRTKIDPSRTALELLAAAREVEPELFVWETKTMDRHLGVVLLPARLSALVLSAFAVLALTLAIIGLYGMVSYAVVQRRREVGIRLSLGANGNSVVTMLLTSGLKLVAIGSIIGLVLGMGASRLLSGLLFNVDALDPVTFLVFPALLLAVSALAAFIPAYGASRVDPASVLRSE